MTAELARRAAETGRLAIDTEFMSERHYQAMLCLAQLAVADPDEPTGVRTEILDPLEDDRDPGPVAAALADPAVEVVVHAGRQDVAILKRTWATEVRNVFDTQVAAGFLGFGLQEGYGTLVRKVLGIEPAGGEAFTHWDRRPLTDQQLEYARADAAHMWSRRGRRRRRGAGACASASASQIPSGGSSVSSPGSSGADGSSPPTGSNASSCSAGSGDCATGSAVGSAVSAGSGGPVAMATASGTGPSSVVRRRISTSQASSPRPALWSSA